MRVLVCGSRGWTDAAAVQDRLSDLYDRHGADLIVIEGGASGVDGMARSWAQALGAHVATVDAGYPLAWHATIKHAVREAAGHRCVRCLHPYVCGKSPGEWSPCDDAARTGPVPLSYTADDGSDVHEST
jgi:hypothetical protein